MSGRDGERGDGPPLPGMAILLLQAAASEAEIGPFARFARETPQRAAMLYREGRSGRRPRPRPVVA